VVAVAMAMLCGVVAVAVAVCGAGTPVFKPEASFSLSPSVLSDFLQSPAVLPNTVPP